MDRRTLLKSLTGGGLLAGLGGGYHWLTRSRDQSQLAVDLALKRLSGLNLGAIETTGAWEVSWTFDHLAQSVEFSMDGFPIVKPKIFRSTVGPLAFQVFQARGRMSHGLDEVIPGEQLATSPRTPTQSRDRLLTALQRFDNFDGSLKPHFAYGTLDKDKYALAHVMHVNDHLEEFRNV